MNAALTLTLLCQAVLRSPRAGQESDQLADLSRTAYLHPDPAQAEANAGWASMQPSATVQIVLGNPESFGLLTQGKTYRVTFEEVK